MGHRYVLVIVIMLCAFCGTTVAQPQARKFHELVLGFGTPSSGGAGLEAAEEEMKLHLPLYAKQLRRENAKAYIIGYGPRVNEWHHSSFTYGYLRANAAARGLWDYFPYQRIIAIDGGFREKAVTELWIVPRGASAPTPTPTVKSNEVVHCPHIQLNGPRYDPRPNAPLTFTAFVQSRDLNIKPSLSWQVSDGIIVSGQETNISVAVPENTSGTLVTTVTANGYSLDCPVQTTTARFNTVVGVGYYKFDDYEQICEETEKAILDFFSMEMKDPDVVAYVVFYGGRCYSSCEIDYPKHRPHYPRRGEAERRAGRIKPYLIETRGIDENRIFVVNGGFRESWTVELWLAPKGAPPPPLTPTTDAKDIQYRTGKVTKRELVSGCMGTKQ